MKNTMRIRDHSYLILIFNIVARPRLQISYLTTKLNKLQIIIYVQNIYIFFYISEEGISSSQFQTYDSFSSLSGRRSVCRGLQKQHPNTGKNKLKPTFIWQETKFHNIKSANRSIKHTGAEEVTETICTQEVIREGGNTWTKKTQQKFTQKMTKEVKLDTRHKRPEISK